ncbi:flagellar motor protein MotB [Lachnospiraceae bacterium 54-53]
MIKKDKKPEELGSWMDTYGDMVTLLLCFFVLLYSMSSVDQTKWRLLVQSFNPSALEGTADQVVLDAKVSEDGGELTGSAASDGGEITDFNDLYLVLKKVVEERNMEDTVEVTRGDGFTFISFRDKVFFDGDSSVLRQEGKDVLDQFAAAMFQADSTIKEVQVLGHTSQGNPERPNNIRNDRMLSAQRSAEVIIYLQSKNAVSPEKLVGMSFGQFRPIAPFNTEDGRAKNRRVEILITKSDTVEKSLEEYYNQVYHNNLEETDN